MKQTLVFPHLELSGGKIINGNWWGSKRNSISMPGSYWWALWDHWGYILQPSSQRPRVSESWQFRDQLGLPGGRPRREDGWEGTAGSQSPGTLILKALAHFGATVSATPSALCPHYPLPHPLPCPAQRIMDHEHLPQPGKAIPLVLVKVGEGFLEVLWLCPELHGEPLVSSQPEIRALGLGPFTFASSVTLLASPNSWRPPEHPQRSRVD